MTSYTLYTKLETLPSDLKKEAMDFIDSFFKKNNPIENGEIKKPVFGSLKGKIWMSEDFDEPLDIFEDYM